MKFTVRVPATSANLGSGSDCLGLALSMYLSLHIENAEQDSFVFGRGFDAPIAKEDNLVLKAMEVYAERSGRKLPPLRMEMESDIPVCRGLGSSSSAIIAGLIGAAAILGERPETEYVLRLATEIEGHPDNVTPALTGGFTMAYADGETLLYRRSDAPDVHLVAAVPSYRLSTRKAREVLPAAVPLKEAIGQLQRAVVLSGALASGDLTGLRALTEDKFFAPSRSALMPGYEKAVRSALEAGALCAMTSGAGPTILAFSDEKSCVAVGEAMMDALNESGVSAEAYTLVPDNTGAIILDSEGKLLR